jgi:hypothetical protein
LSVIVCALILTKVDKVTMTNHIVSMKDEKEYFKPNINALIKWWIPLDLLQLRCRWIKDLVAYSYGNKSYCSNELSTKEKKNHCYYYKWLKFFL